MSARRVLVTGGAGFVGSHLVDALLDRGDEVRIFDNLDPQVHGPERRKPTWLPQDAEFVLGDVRDPAAVAKALGKIDVVYHLAAAVGVGQSMYQITDYTAVNTLGTAHLLQALVDQKIELDRLVVASSMSVYGEGSYQRPDGRAPSVSRRGAEQLSRHEWELHDVDGTPLTPVPTPESKELDPSSIYALNKADQERMVLQVGAAYAIPSVALRFFNIFGPRQALTNPYTGVVAIFSSRLMNGNPPLMFEDGLQSRDFVSVHDVVQALLLSGASAGAIGGAYNIGSGHSVTVRDVATTLEKVLGTSHGFELSGRYRVGDIRHCFADISSARNAFGYIPAVTLEEGMSELVEWLQQQEKPLDSVASHAAELTARGLTR